MAVKNKTWALDQLRHKRNAYIYTLAAMYLLNSPAVLSLKDKSVLLRGDALVFDPAGSVRTGQGMEVRFNQVIEAYEQDRQNFATDLQELYKFTRRNLIKESYEVLKACATKQRLLTKVESETWYWFAYHVRNAVTHNFHWEFRGRTGRAKLPLTWNGKTIDPRMERNELKTWFLDPLTTYALIIEISNFVRDN